MKGKTLQLPDGRIRTCKKCCNIPKDLNLQVKDVLQLQVIHSLVLATPDAKH
jgi:hypothetical protein